MSENDGPPNLISDGWQQRHEPRRAAVDPDPDGRDSYPQQSRPDLLEVPVVAEESSPHSEPPEPDVDQPPPEPPVPSEEPAHDHLASIEAELRTLRAETVHVNQILDRLHAENERLRRGESEQILLPLFRDLIKLSDDWTAMATSWDAKETATPADVATRCRDVADDAGLILARHGVEPLSPTVGTAIDRKQHRIVATVAAEKPELDNTVAEVRRIGYVYGGKVLKFAEVVVAKP